MITLCLRWLHGFARTLRHRIAAGGAALKLAAEVVEKPHVRETAGTPLILRQLGEDVSFVADFDSVIYFAVANDLACRTAIRTGVDQIAAGLTHRGRFGRHTGKHTERGKIQFSPSHSSNPVAPCLNTLRDLIC